MQSDFIAFSLLHNKIIPIHGLIAVSALGPNFVLYENILLKVNEKVVLYLKSWILNIYIFCQIQKKKT